MIRKLIFIFLMFCLGQQAKSQNYYEPKFSFSVDLGIPAKSKNDSFRQVMQGLFNGGINFQYNIYGGLTAGLGLKYSFFTLNPFALNNAPWGASFHMPAINAKIGYERFTTERVSFNISAKIGYSGLFSIHGNDSCEVGLERNPFEMAFFVEPQFEIVLLTEKASSDGFSLVLGYPFYFNEFGPRYLCLDKFPNLIAEDYVGITRFFSFGFGYRYYFGRK